MRMGYKRIQVKTCVSLICLVIWCLGSLLFPLGSTVEGNTGEGIEIPKEEIRAAVVRYLKRNHPWKTAEVRIREVRIPSRVVLSTPRYDLSLRVSPNTRYLGRTPVEIHFNRGGPDQKRIWASAYLEVLSPVVITRRPLVRNEIISADDICLEKKDLAKVPPGAITDITEVIGQRVRRTLGVGAVLRDALVDKPPVVKRGDVVTLLIETRRLKITALGRVDQQGARGDTVRVVNLDSRRRVYGQVLDSRTVRVRF